MTFFNEFFLSKKGEDLVYIRVAKLQSLVVMLVVLPEQETETVGHSMPLVFNKQKSVVLPEGNQDAWPLGSVYILTTYLQHCYDLTGLKLCSETKRDC